MTPPTLQPPRGIRAARPNPRDERLELRAERLMDAHDLLPRTGPLLVGVSGGPDSIALLDFLRLYHQRTGNPPGGVVAAHVNHGLRGAESDADHAFVEELADREGLRFLASRVDPVSRRSARGESPEQAARALRYEALREMAARVGADRAAVAHTADDQAETVLLRLIRGAGLAGLSGIKPRRRVHGLLVVRPLLTTTREQVLSYLERRGLPHRLDSSNQTPDARRNFLRLEILPRIREGMNPRIRETLLREAAQFGEADAYLAEEARLALPRVIRTRGPAKITLDAAALLEYPRLLRKYLFRCALQELNEETLDLSKAHIEALLSLLDSSTGRSADMPKGIRARRGRGTVVLERRETEPWRVGGPSKA